MADELLAAAIEIGGAKLVVGEKSPAAPVEAMRGQIDRLRQKAGSVGHSARLEERGRHGRSCRGRLGRSDQAGDQVERLIKPLAEIIGGKGGGPPHLATAGGKEANRLAEALNKACRIGAIFIEPFAVSCQ